MHGPHRIVFTADLLRPFPAAAGWESATWKAAAPRRWLSHLLTPGVTHVTPDLDVVTKHHPRAIAWPAAATDDHLIRDRALHFRVRGFNFASLDVVLERKQTQRREKDLADVARVGRLRPAGRL